MFMKQSEILARVDHTYLKQTAVWDDIREICDDAVTYHTASVCIPPSFVKQAREYLEGRMRICTVIGFPNGYATTSAKLFETADALANGADEIDTVIHLGALKECRYDAVLAELRALKNVCGSRILKVIVETCLLNTEEKIRMCEIVTESGADYIKTSTGFSTAGATFDDVALFAEHIGPGVRIKAAGGISSFEDAERFLTLGASRLGTSRLVRIMKSQTV